MEIFEAGEQESAEPTALAAIHYPDGETTVYNYATGRLSSASIGAGLITLGYDPGSGQVTGATNSHGDSVSFTYQGAIITACDWAGTITGRVASTLGQGLLVTSQTIDGISTVSYSFDRDTLLTDSVPGLQPFGFAGGQYDPDTGLVRFGQRDYSAETGTWTARDTIDFNGGQYNMYAYANGDPVNNTDALGTGPFGFLNRNRQRAIDAAADTTPGKNQRFANALDKYDRSVKAAVLTGQVLVTTGDMVNRVTWAMAGARASGSSLTSSSSRLGSSTGRSTLSSKGRAPIGRIMAPRGGGPGVGGGPAPEPPPPPAPRPDRLLAPWDSRPAPAPSPVPLDQSSLLLNFL